MPTPSIIPGHASGLPQVGRDEPERRLTYLQPGQIVVVREPTLIKTIVGSCVAVCLFDPRLRIGGMNHFVLAESPARTTQANRYGDAATRELILRMTRTGSRREDLRAKIVGGARMSAADAYSWNSVGERNQEIARRILQDAGVPVSSEDVGGARGRRVVFDTEGGFLHVVVL